MNQLSLKKMSVDFVNAKYGRVCISKRCSERVCLQVTCPLYICQLRLIAEVNGRAYTSRDDGSLGLGRNCSHK